MSRLAVAFAVIAGFLAAATSGRCEVTFALSFPDVASDTNQNWDDPTYGSQARATLQSVLDEVGREFAETATIQLEITSSVSRRAIMPNPPFSSRVLPATRPPLSAGRTAGSGMLSWKFTGCGNYSCS